MTETISAISDHLKHIDDQLKHVGGQKEFSVPPIRACVSPGTSANLPELRPCLKIRWGNSPRDELETNDEEILCLVASNPYTNVIFKDLTVVTILTELNGNSVPVLPDGTPSVEITPSHIVFFGDLPPLASNQSSASSNPQQAPEPEEHPYRTPAGPLDPTSVVREVVLISRGAKPGEYVVKLRYTFSVEFLLAGSDDFQLELVAS